MKKIKSVKLKNDYRTWLYFFPRGTELIPKSNGCYVLGGSHEFPNACIIDNTTDLFEIEYEPEMKSITVKIEYTNYLNNKRDLNATDVFHCLESHLIIYGNFKVTEVKND